MIPRVKTTRISKTRTTLASNGRINKTIRGYVLWSDITNAKLFEIFESTNSLMMKHGISARISLSTQTVGRYRIIYRANCEKCDEKLTEKIIERARNKILKSAITSRSK